MAGLTMFVAVLLELSNHGKLFGACGASPNSRATASPLVGPYGTVFLLAFLFIKLFEYDGGMLARPGATWPPPPPARRSARRGCWRCCGWSGR
ncbi:hypothetical protein TPAU25S_00893 [Tsukamurella paurometabola]